MRQNVMFCRFPYGASEHPAVGDWLVSTVLKAKADPQIGEVLHITVDDTPITMSRNRALKAALDRGADLVCMVDSDMHPDLPGQKPFWETSLEFMRNHQGPCVVAAPYCGPPPHENIYVFRWATQETDRPGPDFRLDQFTREEAAVRGGIEEVAALPTGLIMIDVRALARTKPPWFEYEWADPPFCTQKATTEDVFFTRNLGLAGVPQYVNWDSWAGHYKTKRVGKPVVLTADSVREQFREALLSGHKTGERLIHVGEWQPTDTRDTRSRFFHNPAPVGNGAG